MRWSWSTTTGRCPVASDNRRARTVRIRCVLRRPRQSAQPNQLLPEPFDIEASDRIPVAVAMTTSRLSPLLVSILLNEAEYTGSISGDLSRDNRHIFLIEPQVPGGSDLPAAEWEGFERESQLFVNTPIRESVWANVPPRVPLRGIRTLDSPALLTPVAAPSNGC